MQHTNCPECDRPLPPVNEVVSDSGIEKKYALDFHKCDCGKDFISSERTGCYLDVLDMWMEKECFEDELDKTRYEFGYYVFFCSGMLAISIIINLYILYAD